MDRSRKPPEKASLTTTQNITTPHQRCMYSLSPAIKRRYSERNENLTAYSANQKIIVLAKKILIMNKESDRMFGYMGVFPVVASVTLYMVGARTMYSIVKVRKKRYAR